MNTGERSRIGFIRHRCRGHETLEKTHYNFSKDYLSKLLKLDVPYVLYNGEARGLFIYN